MTHSPICVLLSFNALFTKNIRNKTLGSKAAKRLHEEKMGPYLVYDGAIWTGRLDNDAGSLFSSQCYAIDIFSKL
jgi:hypothetical protein